MEMFLPRLNKAMQVQVQDVMRDGKRVRKIHVREKDIESQKRKVCLC